MRSGCKEWRKAQDRNVGSSLMWNRVQNDHCCCMYWDCCCDDGCWDTYWYWVGWYTYEDEFVEGAMVD